MPGKVVVIGSINVDIVARGAALPRAGETVAGEALALHLGGKGGNQAVAAARAGASAAMIGAVGDVDFGVDARALLAGYGVDVGGVAAVAGPTGAALIAVDAVGENQIVVVPGANAAVADPGAPGFAPGDVALSQMETPPEAAAALFARARAAGARTMLNAAPALQISDPLKAEVDVLIVNETELSVYAGIEVAGEASAADLADAMQAARRDPAQVVVATLGARGALTLEGETLIETGACKAARVVDTTGAGDCFCGALAARMAAGDALADALEFAAAAASLAVEVEGAAPSMPDAAAIRARLAG